MTRTVRVNTTLDDDLLERIDAFARERREDRSTAIRQLVDIALRELSKREALTAYREGRLTLREFAAALHLGIWAAHDLLLAEGVAVAQGSRAETDAAIQSLLPALTARRPPRSPSRGQPRASAGRRK
jgi:predicted transcriptional regulator